MAQSISISGLGYVQQGNYRGNHKKQHYLKKETLFKKYIVYCKICKIWKVIYCLHNMLWMGCLKAYLLLHCGGLVHCFSLLRVVGGPLGVQRGEGGGREFFGEKLFFCNYFFLSFFTTVLYLQKPIRKFFSLSPTTDGLTYVLYT